MTISPLLMAGAIGLVVAYLLTPAIQRMATHFRVLDLPGSRRIHLRPVPRLGGIAVYAAFVAAVVFPIDQPIRIAVHTQHLVLTVPSLSGIDRPVLGMLLGATLIALFGILDDVRGAPPLVKLFGQVASAVVVLPFGIGMDVLTNPLGGMFFVGPLGALLTVLWIVALCNVMNLIDGVDGLAAGIATIAGGTVCVAAFQRGDVDTGLLAAALMGATLGFLPYNFNPARIFLGDTGSMLLGYILATMSVLGTYKSYTALSLLVPLVALGVPVADTAFAIVRRWRTRRPIFQADAEHLHHHLLRRGLSQRQTAALLYLITATLGAGALVLSGIHRPSLEVVFGLLVAALALGARRMRLLAPARSPAASGGAGAPTR